MEDPIQHKPPFKAPPAGTAFENQNGRSVIIPKQDFDYVEVERRIGWGKELSIFFDRERDLIAAARLFRDFLVYLAGGKTIVAIGCRCIGFLTVYWPGLIGERIIAKVAYKFGLPRQALDQYISRLREEMKKRRPPEQKDGAT